MFTKSHVKPSHLRRRLNWEMAKSLVYSRNGAEYVDGLNPEPAGTVAHIRFKRWYEQLRDRYFRVED